MARIQTIVCDRCGGKKGAAAWQCSRGKVKAHGDLCDDCWTELLELFRPSTQPRGRHQIVVIDPADIPKT